MEVSINGGTQEWMVYRENPIKMDDWGVSLFQETSIWENHEQHIEYGNITQLDIFFPMKFLEL